MIWHSRGYTTVPWAALALCDRPVPSLDSWVHPLVAHAHVHVQYRLVEVTMLNFLTTYFCVQTLSLYKLLNSWRKQAIVYVYIELNAFPNLTELILLIAFSFPCGWWCCRSMDGVPLLFRTIPSSASVAQSPLFQILVSQILYTVGTINAWLTKNHFCVVPQQRSLEA